MRVRPIRIKDLDEMHRELVSIERRLTHMNETASSLRTQLRALHEHREAAQMAAVFFRENIGPLLDKSGAGGAPASGGLKRHHSRHLDSEALLGFGYEDSSFQKINTGYS